MSDTENKIVRLLSSAKKKGDREEAPAVESPKADPKSIMILLLMACLAALGIWEYTSDVDAGQTISSLRSEMHDLRATLEKKDELLKNAIVQEEVSAYIDRLELGGVRVTNINHEIKVSGRITNTGHREIDDIVLTVYCLDDNDRPVCKQQHIASSPDAEPLKKHQNRRFKLVIEDVPPESKEIQVTVSNMDFAD
jgi:hypothetical protein